MPRKSILNAINILFLLGVAFGVTACGSKSGSGSGGTSTSATGFWRLEKSCHTEKGKPEECYEMKADETSSYYEINAGGELINLDGTKDGCKISNNQFFCGKKSIGTFTLSGSDRAIIKLNFENEQYSDTYVRVPKGVFFSMRNAGKEQKNSLQKAITQLLGKKLELVSVEQIKINKATGEKSERSEKAADIPETREWTNEETNTKYTDVYPKVVRFVNKETVLINNKLSTKYEIVSFGTQTDVQISLQLTNGKLDENFSTPFGEKIEIEGGFVKVSSEYESTGRDENNKETQYLGQETKIYQIVN